MNDIDEILSQIKELIDQKPHGWCERVIELYDQAIKEYGNKEDDVLATLLYDYAAFLQNNKLYHLIGDLYDRALHIYGKLARKEPYVYKYCIACVFISLANIHSNQELYDQAETEYLAALRIFQSLAKVQHHYLKDVATTQHNLATDYMKKYEFKKAETLLKKALIIRRELAKDNSFNNMNLLATTLDVMGNLYDKMMKYKASETAYQEALNIRTELSESNSLTVMPDIASVLSNLGTHYYGKGDLSKAEHYYNESLKISYDLSKENPSYHNQHIAELLYNLSLIHSDVNNFMLAQEELDEALGICKFLVRDNQEVHSGLLANILCQLAGVHTELIKYDLAESEYKRALEIRRALYNIHPEVYGIDFADTLVNLATLYCDREQLDEAKDTLNNAIEVYEGLMKDYDVPCLEEYATALNNLGNIYSDINSDGDINMLTKADELFSKSLSIREDLATINPAITSDISMTLNNLANLHSDMKNYEKAEDEYKKAKDILIKLVRKEPELYRPCLAQTLNNLASLRIQVHTNEKDAENDYKKAIRIYQTLDKKKPSTYSKKNVANTLSNLAKLYFDKGKLEEAKRACEKALKIFTGLAQDEPITFGRDVASIRFRLSDLYSKMGRDKKAKKQYQLATSIQRILSEANPSAISENDFKIEAYNDIKKYYLIGESMEETLIYKYMSIDTALFCLDSGQIRFQQPNNWSDEYEGLYYKSRYDNVKNGLQFRKSLYACCMAQNKASEAAWKMYTYDGKGLKAGCVEFILNRQKLRNQLSQYAEANNMTVFEGKVNYSQSDYTIQTIGKKMNPLYNLFFKDFDLGRYLSLLLLKRQAFSHESEVRFFLVPDQKVKMKKYINIDIQWAQIVEGILIDKNCGYWDKKLFKDYVKSILPDVTVEEYDVHSAPKEYSYHIE